MHPQQSGQNIKTLIWQLVLVLAGTEVIFFTGAGAWLCVGFVLNTVLKVQGCFCYCWAVLAQSQGLSTHQQGGWGCTQLGGDTVGTTDPK